MVSSLTVTGKTTTGKNFTVVIDAGHGGHDTGAVGNGELEKNINLKVAKQLESIIKKKMKEAKVIMTRDDDTYLTLQQRADKANKAKGDLFISIHTNSVDANNKNRKSIAGSSVYTLGLHKDEDNLQVAMRENAVIEFENDYEQKYSGFDPQKDESYIIFEMAQKKNLSQSIKLAENIQRELVGIGRKDRGVHQAGFWVLWATSMPSVLVELDFICNPESAKYIASDKGAKEMAEAIYNAVERYEASMNAATATRVAVPTEPLAEEPVIQISEKEEQPLAMTKNTKSTQSNRKKNKDKKKDNKKEERETKESDREDVNIIIEEPVETEAIAVANTRRESRSHVADNHTSSQKKSTSTRRKRRSNESKKISTNTNYETDFIAVANTKRSTTVGQSTGEDQQLTASNSKKENKKNEKKKSTKEKPKKEKKEKNSVKRERKSNHNAKVNKIVTVYKIQVLASDDLLNSNNARFCGLSPISTYKEDNKYKYYYGESTDLREIEAMLTDVKEKRPDAFIVASKNSIQTK